MIRLWRTHQNRKIVSRINVEVQYLDGTQRKPFGPYPVGDGASIDCGSGAGLQHLAIRKAIDPHPEAYGLVTRRFIGNGSHVGG